jgi:hypothetical protein
MNKSKYFNYIEEKLNILSYRVSSRGKLNILDFHIHSENFYRDFLNLLYGFKLRNLNETKQNIEAIDLISDEDKIIIQVSATCTKDKVEKSLIKDSLKKYEGYNFKFISIAKNTDKIKEKNYKNENRLIFDSKKDICDIDSILAKVLGLTIIEQKQLYIFIKEELGSETEALKLDSNLATVINILSKESLGEDNEDMAIDSFEIDRKISFNNLEKTKLLVDDYGFYHSRLDKLYSEYDKSGKNKSHSVLLKIRSQYIENLEIKKDDDLFLLIIKNIKDIILTSANFSDIPTEELDLCINIVVVDAFIRCKIFKNPNNYKYAIA